MIRHHIEARPDWSNRVTTGGSGIVASAGTVRWNESICYELSRQEADEIDTITNELYQLMVDATDLLIDDQLFSHLGIALDLIPEIVASWNDADYLPTVFTRFDFSIASGRPPHLVQTQLHDSSLLLQAAVEQWHWANERVPWATQYNTIEERLTAMWREYRISGRPAHFSFHDGNLEQYLAAKYLAEIAHEAGVRAELVALEDLSYDRGSELFLDHSGSRIELLVRTGYSESIAELSIREAHRRDSICITEPLWKDLWSLPEWLPYLRRVMAGNPLLELVTPGRCEGTLCSSWIIAGHASGIGIIEHVEPGTKYFVPHLLD